jgi:hypothetical protein
VEEGHPRCFAAAHVQVDVVADAQPQAVAVEAQAGVVVVHREHDVAQTQVRGFEAREASGAFSTEAQRPDRQNERAFPVDTKGRDRSVECRVWPPDGRENYRLNCLSRGV